jgi:hypothetical protein
LQRDKFIYAKQEAREQVENLNERRLCAKRTNVELLKPRLGATFVTISNLTNISNNTLPLLDKKNNAVVDVKRVSSGFRVRSLCGALHFILYDSEINIFRPNHRNASARMKKKNFWTAVVSVKGSTTDRDMS